MLTKQERKTQKTVLAQRDAARAEVESLKSEVERLKGDVHVLAGEEIAKATAESKDTVRRVEFERDKANRERDALLKNFDSAIAVRLEATRKELEETAAKLQAARREVVGLVQRNSAQSAELDKQRDAIDEFIVLTTAQNNELNSLKMEDAKNLRKRLQTKTQRVTELEAELAQTKRAAVNAVSAALSPAGLTNMLNSRLRAKLRADDEKASPEVVKASPDTTAITATAEVPGSVSVAPEAQ